jgi:hypothetical protein
MKKIQELLLESEQLRLETDDAGPQVRFCSFFDDIINNNNKSSQLKNSIEF